MGQHHRFAPTALPPDTHGRVFPHLQTTVVDNQMRFMTRMCNLPYLRIMTIADKYVPWVPGSQGPWALGPKH